jgi:hypothetical protein
VRAIIDTILENTPYTNVYDDSPKEKDNPIPGQKEEVSIVESLPNLYKDSSANHIPKPSLGTPKEEEINPIKFPFQFEEDLCPSVGNTMNYPIQQRLLSPLTTTQHILNLYQDLVAHEPLESISSFTSDTKSICDDLRYILPCFFADDPNQEGASNSWDDIEWKHESSKSKIPIPIESKDGYPLVE